MYVSELARESSVKRPRGETQSSQIVHRLILVLERLPDCRVIAVAQVLSGNLVLPGASAEALFFKGVNPARLFRAIEAMMDPECPAF